MEPNSSWSPLAPSIAPVAKEGETPVLSTPLAPSKYPAPAPPCNDDDADNDAGVVEVVDAADDAVDVDP